MKKIISALFICLITLVLGSCVKAKKNVQDYFVKVKTVSAVVQNDGSVLVTAEIESVGGAPVENIGFSCGTTENHKLTTRQMDGSLSGSVFTAVYQNLAADSTYFFKAFATNAYGYVRGASVAVSGITPAPVVPTCTFVLGYIDLGGFAPDNNLSFGNLTPSFNIYQANGSSSQVNMQVRFNGIPKTGIWTIDNNYSPSLTKGVFISFNVGFISGSLNSGANVYVNEISVGVFDVYICNATWTYGSTTYNAKSHFQVAL